MASQKNGMGVSFGLLVLLFPVLAFSVSWAARLLTQQEMIAIQGGSSNPPVAVAQVSPSVAAVDDTVSFNGQWSYDPDGDTISLSWDFDDGQNSTAMNPSHYYSSADAYTPVLTVTDYPVWYSSQSDTDSVSVTVVDVNIVGSSYVTRGNTAIYTAVVHPSGLSPIFEWQFSTGNISENTGTTNTWSGTMVVGGWIDVKATINGVEVTDSMYVTVASRGWETSIPFSTNTSTWGTASPSQGHDLGNTTTSFSTTGRNTDEVSSGPNKGLKWVVAQNISAPATIKINKHFSDPDPPQSWIDFKNAQGDAGEAEYSAIEPAVKKHEGFSGTGDLVTDSHYKYWHVDCVAKGQDAGGTGDMRIYLEDWVGSENMSLPDFDTMIRDWVLDQTVSRSAKMASHEPSGYLGGKSIDYSYPD